MGEMTDIVLLGISVLYGILVILAATLLVLSLRSRRAGTPSGRPVLLALAMVCLLLQGLLLLVAILWSGLPETTFLLYGSALEAAGVAFLLAASLS